MAANQLAPPRVIATAHTADGKSIIASDAPAPIFKPFGPNGTGFSTFHTATRVPVSNVERLQPAANTIPRPAPEGALFCISDFQPGGGSPMHRSLTLDYAFVLSGEVTLTLDTGMEVTVKAGEVVLQRGTMHKWTNNGTEPCRVAVVMMGSEKVVLADGTPLEAEIIRPT
ncbi:MAG: hypothetical protein M1838_006095 [Thelocarpon superellum]|nr:MAG: hypothetical protein M1838_006095 [Thelocarpon superellum]